MTRTLGRLALFFAITGLVVSVASTYVHYRLLHDPGYHSFCDVSAAVSCTDVFLSRFGMLRGLPVALLGTLWFALMLVLTLVGVYAPPAARENVPGYLFASSTVGLALVLYLAYASFFILKTVCMLCLTTYAAVVGLFLVSGMATSFPMTTLPRRAAGDFRRLRSSPLALALTLLVLAGAGSAIAFFPREGAAGAGAAEIPRLAGNQQSEFERQWAAMPRVPLVIPSDGAKVLVVKFNDYQCPPCKQSFMSYKPIFEKYQASNPGAVKFITKDYPLDSKCNPNVAAGGPHPAACEAAVAVRLARAQNRGEAMEEWLFMNQSTLTPPIVRQAAHDIAGIKDFDAQYARTIEQVKADIAFGKQLGVSRTPTFFINGVKMEGVMAPAYFDAALAYEIKRGAASNP